MKDEKAVHDPELYEAMSKPFGSSEEADRAIGGFLDDLSAIREKHRIANVYVINMVNYRDADGDVVQAIQCGHIGDMARAEGMTAYAYGKEKRYREMAVRELLEGNRNPRKSEAPR